jgi:Putative transposase/Transposase zinc-binding domain
MGRPALEVADIFRIHGPAYRDAHGHAMSTAQRRVMRAIEICRTAALGGHVDKCDRCGHRRISYNSCANRHCNKCQSLARAKGLAKHSVQVLPVSYFHVVFTVPEQIAAIALQNKKAVYDILFRAGAATLRRIAVDPRHLGGKIGFLAVLHTWGQNLQHHPHVHCVVPGGGLSPDGRRWVACRNGFFLPVRVLSRLFRGLFLHAIKEAYAAGKLGFHGSLQPLADPESFKTAVKGCRNIEWVVYAKRPFGGPNQVLDYLGRYTHRAAISNDRLVHLEDGKVTFRWRNYRQGNKQKLMTLEADEFIRRFLLHVLPSGFVRIRHFGLLANCHREAKLSVCRELLGVPQVDPPQSSTPEDWKTLYETLTGKSLTLCPACHQGCMATVEILPPQKQPQGIDSS